MAPITRGPQKSALSREANMLTHYIQILNRRTFVCEFFKEFALIRVGHRRRWQTE